jgi:D-glycero-alpha-D-manno-heptose-7-phosphate kinase
MIVSARAPLRLGLAGGGTDVSPYAELHGGCVLNATIDRYAYAVIRPLSDPVIRLHATDLEVEETLSANGPLPPGGPLALHKAVYRSMVDTYNDGRPLGLELSTFCDAPIGSGLGSSSTLVVAMVRAFVELLNLPLDDYAMAKLAHRIERVDCGLQGGRQDQYSATFGGFNFMEFHAAERAVITPLRVKDWIVSELEASLVLFHTGVSRESAAIIADQSSNVHAGSPEAIEAMHGLKREAQLMKDCLLRGDMNGIVDSMRGGWANKKQSARTVSNPQIEAIYEAALAAGALAGKVSGAGGGGFMLFFVPTMKRMAVIRALVGFSGQVNNCHFTDKGAQAWRP